MVMHLISVVLKTMYFFGKETNIIGLAANKGLCLLISVYKLLVLLPLDPELFIMFESE